MEKKVVVITGVTKGLGRAFIEEFIERGWSIAGCGRSLEAVEELKEECGAQHVFSVVDITSDKAVAKWAHEVTAKMGAPHLLINNAAVINDRKALWELTAAEFSEVMTINVLGSVNVLRHFIPSMIKQGKGIIVNISSSSGREGAGTFAPYCASKFAIDGLTQSLAEELPKGMIAVALDPGGINTDMLKKAYHDEAEQYPTAEERAKVIVPYILSLTPKDNGKMATAPK